MSKNFGVKGFWFGGTIFADNLIIIRTSVICYRYDLGKTRTNTLVQKVIKLMDNQQFNVIY